MATYYVKDSGLNIYPFDTEENAAPNFYTLFDALNSHGIPVLLSGDIVYVIGSIIEPDMWGYYPVMEAAVLGSNPNIDKINLSTGIFEGGSYTNIGFYTDSLDAAIFIYSPKSLSHCTFLGIPDYTISAFQADTSISVICNTFINFYNDAFQINPSGPTEDILIISNSFYNVKGINIKINNTNMNRLYFYNNAVSTVDGGNAVIIDIDSSTIAEFIHDHNISLKGFDYTEDSVPFSPDVSELMIDPVYQLLTPEDLSITESSPCYHSGIYRVDSPTNDIINTEYFNPPSIGAFEVFAIYFHVYYNGNGNTGGTVPTDPNYYIPYSSATILSSGDLVKEGYIFLGWSSIIPYDFVEYNPGDMVILSSGNLTLYAVWDRDFIGGLIGYSESGTTTDSYWDINTSGQSDSDGGEGKSTVELKSQSTFTNWDFSSIWKIEEGISYPQFLIANFSANIVTGNVPLTVNFTNLTSGWPDEDAEIITHYWDFGDGSEPSTEFHPSHTYESSGVFTVTLIETRNYVQVTKTITDYITVSEAISVDFVADKKVGFMQLTVSFTNLTVGIVDSWLWSFGDGHKSVEANPTHFYNHPGIYTVTLKAISSVGVFSATKLSYIIINSASTEDVAPEPDKKAYLWGTGLALKKKTGVDIRAINR